MAARKRDKTLTIRVLEAELTMLGELSEMEGVSASEWLRNIIRREHLLAFTAVSSRRPSSKR